jgi:hypothetical protein
MDFTSISKLTKEKLMKILSRIVLTTMLLGVVTLAQADDKRKNERDHYEYQHHNWYKNESISKAEYLKRHEEIFDRMDSNKDKVLTRDERKIFWESQEKSYKNKSRDSEKRGFWESDDNKYKR